MKGPAGDAIFVVFFILFVALVTVKFWYPPLTAWIASVRKDVDKATKDGVQLKDSRHWEEKEEDFFHPKNIESMTSAERGRLYKERARQAGLGKR